MTALLVIATGCGGGDSEIAIPDECNGAVSLCAKRYDQVVYATAHNAMSSADLGWEPPNHYLGMKQQLADGVRGLMLDTYSFEGATYLCHAVCQLGKTPLGEGLSLIAEFLRNNRGEVVTIIFESYISAADTEAAFRASGLMNYVFARAPNAPWPTLRELVDADTRLIVFTDSPADDPSAYPWYMDVWDHAWETHFSARDTFDFSCAPNRGSTANPLFIFNHFLTRSRPVPEEAQVVNANPFLLDRARQCMNESGALPNFVTVDFYSVGDLFDAVDALNNVP